MVVYYFLRSEVVQKYEICLRYPVLDAANSNILQNSYNLGLSAQFYNFAS